jgi:OOP family OmpA-OmpF porin
MQIEFAFDKAEIPPGYDDQLAEAAAFVKRYPETKILVAGHTDATGEEIYNIELSMRRAEAVKAYLVENLGVDADQLFPRGYGESRPVATNDTAEGRQENRRVEFICCVVIPKEE